MGRKSGMNASKYKRLLPLLALSLIFNSVDSTAGLRYLQRFKAQRPNAMNWTWLGGSDQSGQAGTYGTRGVSSTFFIPRARSGASSKTDAAGNIWLFGGSATDGSGNIGYLNDLWRFNTSSMEWTWVSGSSFFNPYGTYGTKGVTAYSNTPGGRQDSSLWIDSAGQLWVFGGYGYDSSGTRGMLNDLWKFNPATSEWTWVAGSNSVNATAKYGQLNTSGHSNIPGARHASSTWTDSSENFWLFGGRGLASNTTEGLLNDLWKFNPFTLEWTWVSGSNQTNSPGFYGSKNTENSGNLPGSRLGATAWLDSLGNTWLFGGYGNDKNGIPGYLNDLWKFNPSNLNWKWIGGFDDSSKHQGNYGRQGSPGTSNIPTPRKFSSSWPTSSEEILLFGGQGYDYNGTEGALGDLWRFKPATGEWTWLNGTPKSNKPGTYLTINAQDPSTIPGGRQGAASGVDPTGFFWQFGGYGSDKTGNTGPLNDLWRFVQTSLNSPSKLVWNGPRFINPGQCAGFEIIRKDGTDKPSITGTSTSITLSAAGSGTFYADSVCVSASASVTIPARTYSTRLYFKPTTAGTLTLAATATELNGSISVLVGTAPSVANSSINVGPSSLPADGTSTATISITIKDSSSNPLSGLVPVFSISGSGNSYNPCTSTNSFGISTCTIKSTVAEIKKIRLEWPVSLPAIPVEFLPILSLTPRSMTMTTGSGATAAFAVSGGTSPYSYSIVSGPGSINSTTGVYTASPFLTGITKVRVQDSAGNSNYAIINNVRILTNGTVRAAVTDGASWYLGGTFTAANPYEAPHAIAVDATTGTPNFGVDFKAGFNGMVKAMVIEGNSIYFGGEFTSYQGQPAPYLAKIDIPSGTLDTRFTQSMGPNSSVNALAVSGSSLYVGGSFTNYRGSPANYLAKVDLNSGSLDTTFTQSNGPSATVSALAVSGSSLYVGGVFTFYRGSAANYLAKVDLTYGILDTTFTLSTGGPNATVSALAVSGSSLYVGGAFITYRGSTANRLAKVDLTTGNLDTTFTPGTELNGTVYALAVSGSSLYVGGGFTTYRGSAANYLAKVDLTSGILDTTFTQNSGPNTTVYSLAISGSSLYVGGFFTTYRGTTANKLAKVDLSSGNLDTTFTQSTGPNNIVYSLAISGSSLYVGGGFTFYRGIPVQNLAKFDAATWTLDTTFTQSIGTGGSVSALAISGSSLYVGGSFTTYRGSAANYLAKVDLTSGILDTTFTQSTGPNATVSALAVSGSSLYIGGAFTTYRGSTANKLAKVDLTSGNLDTTFTQTTGMDGPVSALAVSGSSLYVGGGFNFYRGSTANYLAKVDLSSGILDTTFTQSLGPSATVSALAVSGSSLYIGGFFTTYRGSMPANYLAKVDLTSGNLDTTFTQSSGLAGGTTAVNALAVSESSLYVGGNFTTYRGATAYGLAKADLTSGNLDFSFTQDSGADMPVFTISNQGSSLYIGGQFTSYRGARAYFFAPVDPNSGNINEITIDSPSAEQSTITASASVPADGFSRANIIVMLKNSQGAPLPGMIPIIAVSGSGNIISPCSPTNNSGVSYCTLASTTGEVKTITLASPALPSVQTTVTFTAAPTTQLVFATPPSTTANSNQIFANQPVVTARDSSDTTISGFTGFIQLGAYADSSCNTPASGTLSATSNPVSATAGMASFAGVKYIGAGTIYLKASSSGVTAACFGPITISPLACMIPLLSTGDTVANWIKTSDFPNGANTIEVIGGGGGGATGTGSVGGGGGGGGAYSKATNVTIIGSASYVVGTGGSMGSSGGASWFCSSTSACTSVSDTNVVAGANGGSGGATPMGGTVAKGIGYSGGNGAAAPSGGKGGGGGGAAGPNGVGLPASGQTGGNGDNGSGGTGGTAAANSGASGNEWGGGYGSGGGGGGGDVVGGTSTAGGVGGAYGAGGGGGGKSSAGGTGAAGLIIIRYSGTTCN
jgi:N-acetylneuraminic acid mutarotase